MGIDEGVFLPKAVQRTVQELKKKVVFTKAPYLHSVFILYLWVSSNAEGDSNRPRYVPVAIAEKF